MDHVTVLIGLAVRGKSIGGVIHQPYYNYKSSSDTIGRTIWGLVGLGVGGFTPQQPPSDKLILTTTRSHSDANVQNAIEALKADDVIRVGGAGHKVISLKITVKPLR